MFVTRGGVPVLGLDASHFELKDDGRLQRPELLAVESVPLTTLLVFDTSDSVRGAKLQALRAAAGTPSWPAFAPRTRSASSPSPTSCDGSRGPPRTRRRSAAPWPDLSAKGATAVWDALSAAMTVLPTASRSLVVVFSDGEDNMSWLDAPRVQAQAARSNALVQVVGLSSPRRPGEPAYVEDLREIAEETGGRFWRADSSARLGDAFRAIIEAMNTRYVLRYDPGPRRGAGLAPHRDPPEGRRRATSARAGDTGGRSS